MARSPARRDSCFGHCGLISAGKHWRGALRRPSAIRLAVQRNDRRSGDFNVALTAAQVEAHYAAAYGSNLAPFVTLQPVPATNYVNLPVNFDVAAAGTVPLTYQWNKVGSGPIAGQTGATRFDS